MFKRNNKVFAHVAYFPQFWRQNYQKYEISMLLNLTIPEIKQKDNQLFIMIGTIRYCSFNQPERYHEVSDIIVSKLYDNIVEKISTSY